MKPAFARNLFFAAISIALFAACDSGSDDGSASSTGGSATPTFPVEPGIPIHTFWDLGIHNGSVNPT